MTLTLTTSTGGSKLTTMSKSSAPPGFTIHRPGSSSEWLVPPPSRRFKKPSMSSFVTIATSLFCLGGNSTAGGSGKLLRALDLDEALTRQPAAGGGGRQASARRFPGANVHAATDLPHPVA